MLRRETERHTILLKSEQQCSVTQSYTTTMLRHSYYSCKISLNRSAIFFFTRLFTHKSLSGFKRNWSALTHIAHIRLDGLWLWKREEIQTHSVRSDDLCNRQADSLWEKGKLSSSLLWLWSKWDIRKPLRGLFNSSQFILMCLIRLEKLSRFARMKNSGKYKKSHRISAHIR